MAGIELLTFSKLQKEDIQYTTYYDKPYEVRRLGYEPQRRMAASFVRFYTHIIVLSLSKVVIIITQAFSMR